MDYTKCVNTFNSLSQWSPLPEWLEYLAAAVLNSLTIVNSPSSPHQADLVKAGKLSRVSAWMWDHHTEEADGNPPLLSFCLEKPHDVEIHRITKSHSTLKLLWWFLWILWFYVSQMMLFSLLRFQFCHRTEYGVVDWYLKIHRFSDANLLDSSAAFDTSFISLIQMN